MRKEACAENGNRTWCNGDGRGTREPGEQPKGMNEPDNLMAFFMSISRDYLREIAGVSLKSISDHQSYSIDVSSFLKIARAELSHCSSDTMANLEYSSKFTILKPR